MDKYYAVLGLRHEASEDEIKQAYRDLVKIWHPDRYVHDPKLQIKAQEKLKEINEAFGRLKAAEFKYSKIPDHSRYQRPRGPAQPPPSEERHARHESDRPHKETPKSSSRPRPASAPPPPNQETISNWWLQLFKNLPFIKYPRWCPKCKAAHQEIWKECSICRTPLVSFWWMLPQRMFRFFLTLTIVLGLLAFLTCFTQRSEYKFYARGFQSLGAGEFQQAWGEFEKAFWYNPFSKVVRWFREAISAGDHEGYLSSRRSQDSLDDLPGTHPSGVGDFVSGLLYLIALAGIGTGAWFFLFRKKGFKPSVSAAKDEPAGENAGGKKAYDSIFEKLDDYELFKTHVNMDPKAPFALKEAARREWERRNLPIEKIEKFKARLKRENIRNGLASIISKYGKVFLAIIIVCSLSVIGWILFSGKNSTTNVTQRNDFKGSSQAVQAELNTKYNPRTGQTFPANAIFDPNTGEELASLVQGANDNHLTNLDNRSTRTREGGSVTASLNKSSARVGEEVLLIVHVIGQSKELQAPRLSEVDGLDAYYTGRAAHLSVINGVSSESVDFSYTLVPQRVGRFTLKPIDIQVGQNFLRTKTLEIEVTGGQGQVPPRVQPSRQSPVAPPVAQDQVASVPSGIDDNIFVQAWVDRKTVYENEQTLLIYTIYTRYDTRYEGFEKEPETSGFWIEEFPMDQNVPRETVSVNGKRYVKADVKKMALFPIAPGNYTIQTGSVKVAIREEPQGSNAFDKFASDSFFAGGGSAARRQNRLLMPPPIQLVVNPLPEKGKPGSFQGAVGNFRLSATIDKDKVKQNEPVMLKVVIEGEGNIETIARLKVPALTGFKTYDANSNSKLFQTEYVIGGTNSFETVFIPKEEGNAVIPSMEFSFFNPRMKKYVTLKTPNFPIQVEKSDHVLKSSEELSMKGGSSKQTQIPEAPNKMMSSTFDPTQITPLSFARKVPLSSLRDVAIGFLCVIGIIFLVSFGIFLWISSLIRKRGERLK